MNKLYSASPRIFNNATELGMVLNSFGFDKGRFLVALPKAFFRELYDNTAGFTELEAKRVKVLVERHKHTILKLGLPYDSNKLWLDNAVCLVTQEQLDGVLSNDEANVAQLYSIHAIADGELPASDGARDYATSDNIIKYMSVVLKTSQEIFFIDPYFCLGKEKYIKFLQALVQQPDSKDTSFIFFCKKEHFETRESFDSLAQRHLQAYMASGCSLTVYPLKNETDMHGRYVFNIYGGVDYDKGFQVDENMRVDFSAMPATLHSSYFDQYIELMKKESTDYSYHAERFEPTRIHKLF